MTTRTSKVLFRTLPCEIESMIVNLLCPRSKFVQVSKAWLDLWKRGPLCTLCISEDEAYGILCEMANDDIERQYNNYDSDE